ncbi:MAG: hypothetical protein WBQ17_10145 [Rhizomicrobium sp.]
MRWGTAIIIGLLAGFACSAANAAQLVVVEARGIGLRPGTLLDPGKTLVLKPGQHVTLISDSGATLSLDGPYNKAPAIAQGQGVTLAATLKGLATEQNARLTEVGTTRGATPAPPLPQAWVIDATRNGSVCLLEGHAPVFWRPLDTKTSDLVIMPADRSWKAQANWPAGMDQIAPPQLVAVHGDAAYFVSLGGVESAISVNTVPAALANDDMRAAWMARKGCDRQAEALLRTRQ